jgi:hypothetical protein
LLYILEQGPVERKIIEQCMRERLPLPRRIADAPSLEMGLELYLDAFFELLEDRASGFSLGKIMWRSISSYCDRLEDLTDSQRDDLHYHVRAMDDAYITWAKSKQPKTKEK